MKDWKFFLKRCGILAVFLLCIAISPVFGADISENDTEYAGILPVIPTADFTADPVSGDAPLEVQFTDTSLNCPTSWAWDFGDGSTSTEQNATHTYMGSGIYTVSLNATNSAGSDTVTMINYITIIDGEPVVIDRRSVVIDGGSVTPSNKDTLLQISNNEIARFDDYGNNTYHFFSATQSATQGLNALHITTDPAESSGQVTLSTSQSGVFYITDTGGRGWDDDSILMLAVNGTIPDNFRASIKASGYQWAPVPTGTYPAFANVTYVADALDETFTKDDFLYGPQIWRPCPATDYPVFDGQDMTDTGNTFSIMFIDLKAGILGANTLSQSDFSGQSINDNGAIRVDYSFENLTTMAAFDAYAYTVSSNQGQGIFWTNCLSATGSSGYAVTVEPTATPTPTPTATPNPSSLTADFTADVTSGNFPLTVQFIDQSTGSPTSWAWDFDNDGVIDSTGRNPTYTYIYNGTGGETYSVNLTVTNGDGSDSEVKTDYIVVSTVATPTGGVIPAVDNVFLTVANDDGVRFDDFGNNTFHVIWTGGGLNALHISSTYSGSDVTNTTDQSGTFYVTMTGGRGYFDEIFLCFAVQEDLYGSIPDDFRLHLMVDGYQWTPVTTPHTEPAFNDTTYVNATLDEWFTKDDLIYGPQTWRPAAGTTFPLYHGQDVSDTSNEFGLMFVDLYGGSLTAYPLRVRYEIENLTTVAAFDVYGYGQNANDYQDCITSWTNRVGVVNDDNSGWTVWGPSFVTVEVAPLSAEVPVNTNKAFSATAYDVNGTEIVGIGSFTWSSSNTTVGIVNETTGIFKALAPGSTVLSALFSDVTGTYSDANATAQVTVPTPIVEFSANVTSGMAPLAVQFTDESTNNPTAWSWDFGDGEVSSEQNPSHLYTAQGNYTVSLAVTSATGSSSLTKTDYIYVPGTAGPTVADVTTYSVGEDTVVMWSNNHNMTTYYGTGTWTAPVNVTEVEYLVVGGGGAGSGHYCSGGGGAGGLLSGTIAVTPGTKYNIMVGAGGIGGDASGLIGTSGFDSQFSTLIATGGGAGGNPGSPGLDGGSGGGAGSSGSITLSGGLGISGQGYAGGSNYPNSGGGEQAGGGGGGAYGVGGTAAYRLGGAGGAGINSSITGTEVLYACGGGGGANLGPGGSGGSSAVNGGTGAGPSTENVNGEAGLDGTGTGGGGGSIGGIGGDGGDGIVIIRYHVPVPGTPIANFTAEPTSGIAPVSVQFTDLSIGTPTAWSWDFGDGDTTNTTEQHPIHTYTTEGNYTVTLTVTNSIGSTYAVKTEYITVIARPVANFTANVTAGNPPLAVQFTDLSINTPTSWSWDFGDGTNSTEQNPSHTYTTSGIYTVTLTATNYLGNDSAVKTDYISVLPFPVTSFTSNVTGGKMPLTVQFTDTSTNTPTSWLWDFGDGATSTEQNATHVYTAAGTYTVTLTATNVYGSDTGTRTNYITVMGEGTGALADTAWPKFGYDSGNTGQSPNDGPQVCNVLWIYNAEADSSVAGSFQYNSPTIGSDGTIYIGNYADNNLYAFNPNGTLKWRYTTGGRLYGAPAIASDGTLYIGSYDNSLYAINPDGTLKWTYATGGRVYSAPAIAWDGTVYVGSNDNNVYAINPDGTLKWTYATSGIIYYGSPAIGTDGTVYVGSYDNNVYAINPDGTLKWTYATGGRIRGSPSIASDGTVYVGSYDYNLHAINPDGTPKWTYATGSYIRSSPAIASDGTVYAGSYDNNLYAINPNGTLKWTYAAERFSYGSPVIGSDGLVYIGSNTHIYAIKPDGTLGWISPSIRYAYYSTPTIGPDGTLYFGTYDRALYAIKDVAPTADFSATPVSGPFPLTVSFTDESNVPTSWAWDFGDGTNSTEQNPVHNYTGPGYYSVSLTVTNYLGSDTETRSDYIIVDNGVYFSADEVSALPPLAVQFTDESIFDPFAWSWDFGDGATSTEQNASHIYTAPGNYTVTLTVTDAIGTRTAAKPDYIYVAGNSARIVGEDTVVMWDRHGATTWTAPPGVSEVEYLVIAGGGAGSGHYSSGGGGAGGLLNGTIAVSPGTEYNVIVGAGGTGGDASGSMGTNGLDSRFSTIIAAGGGAGGNMGGSGVDGGSGGGAGSSTKITFSGGAGISGQGYAGGSNYPNGGGGEMAGGGGGGAGEVGGNGSYRLGGDGGDGINSSITGTAVVYACGGGGAGSLGPGGSGGSSAVNGGTGGGPQSGEVNGEAGLDGTGTGGGGAGWYGTGGDGGDGIVIIRYQTPAVTPVANFTAEPTSGDYPLTVSFTDESANSPTAWSWDFENDGVIDSTDQNPSHTYMATGTYSVNLTVANDAGSDSLVRTDIITVSEVSGSEPLPDYNNVFFHVANDAGVKYDAFGNQTYNVRFEGSNRGLNALHISTDPAENFGQVTVSDGLSGTFYATDSGGKGYEDEIILMVAVNGTIPDDFSLHVISDGYTWTPNPVSNQPPSLTDVTYQSVSLDETFTAADFRYGPQIWKPSGNGFDYPIYSGQNMMDTENTFRILFIDLNSGVLRPDATLENRGAVRINYSFENLTTFASFNVYGYCQNSNSGTDMVAWTNALTPDKTMSGYSVVGQVPVPEPASIVISPSTVTLERGETLLFNATGYDASGTVLPESEFVWSCANTTVGTIVGNGLFSALRPGNTTVCAACGDVNATASVSVPAGEIEPAARGGGGGGSSSSVSTARTDDIGAGETGIFMLSRTAVTEVDVKAATTIQSMMLTAEKVSPADGIVDAPPEVYQYIRITSYLAPEDAMEMATLKFSVDREWLDSIGAGASDVKMYHYNEATETWDILSTVSCGEDGTCYIFFADTPSFSLFAISAEPGSAPSAPVSSDDGVQPAAQSGDTPASGEQAPAETQAPAATTGNTTAIVIVGVFVILAICGGVYWQKKNGEE